MKKLAWICALLAAAQMSAFAIYGFRDLVRPSAGAREAARLMNAPRPHVPITISASAAVTAFGTPVTLSGLIRAPSAGVPVTILYRSHGSLQLAPYATTKTVPGAGDVLPGTWTLTVSPSTSSVFVARWRGGTSRAVLVKVGPRLRLTEVGRHRLQLSVQEAENVADWTPVVLQRRASGHWVTFMRLRLRRYLKWSLLAQGTVSPTLQPGRHVLRLSVGPDPSRGYAAMTSPPLVYRR